MAHFPYNSPEYDQIYKEAHDNWLSITGSEGDYARIVERNIRDFCKAIANTPWGLSRWGCEGHPEKVRKTLGNSNEAEGYIMIIPLDRYCALELIECLNLVFNDVVEAYGWNAAPEIEAGSCMWGEDNDTYPCVTFRTPKFPNRTARNSWWKLATNSFIKHSKDACQ